jgi:hypothetical protein
MIARRLGILAALALVVGAVAGCGASASQRTPAAGDIPLVPGAEIAVQARACDHGSRVYCAIDVVVVDHHYVSSDNLARDESHVLRKHGWSLADGDTRLQSGANSPGHKLRLTLATATGDLRQIDLGQINRPWPITYALSNALFDRTAAMSMMLEVGSAS